MIVTGHSYVSHPLGRARIPQNAIYDDKFMDGYRRLADAVRKHGARLMMQLSHAGRQTAPEIVEGQMPLAPSDLFDETGGRTARAMTADEMSRIRDDYTAGALRARRAGLDGVQIHMAHGYLMAQFLSPFTNKRDDEYGGSLDRRLRFPREVVRQIREAVGSAFPILIKLNSTDGLPESYQPQLSLEDVVYFARILAGYGVDAIEVSGGTVKENRTVMSKPDIAEPCQEAYFAPAAQAIKVAVDVPVILVGGVRSLSVMESMIHDKVADMISLCRPFVREPDLVHRLKAGQLKASCVSCNACFNPKGLKCYYRGPSSG